ncbi:TetR/AcrR family transcriptional regulator [Glycomyces harbinensis]|uniref:Transcriptional regulator, TetR family n=1 Tax=Glycomyces harbinensis TaxID=58114 RepID=A0A1G6WWH1_9ACTN|nr:TetR family transcriptional regulator [Glycomyces harbinensis]SDD70191.1 transcriptional regulator, TetR family [Glycomyces harbinensis]
MSEPTRESKDTKYRIAETAMALFLEQGYETVTVEAVAEASEVSRRTVFRYFGGKDELPFPDHSGRLRRLESHLNAAGPDEDPVEAVIGGTEASLRDFLQHPQLVFRRYRLTRRVPELRNREIVEHERYVAMTSAFLRGRLAPDAPGFQAMGLAALIDAMHRSALGGWARSEGATDAMAELQAGMAWVRGLTSEFAHPSPVRQMLLATLPDTPEVRRTLTALRDSATELP